MGGHSCIEKLAHAGIKVWISTGNNLETALNVGFVVVRLDKE